MLLLGRIKRLVKKKYQDLQQMNRFQHTLGVVKMSVALAKKYGVSVKKAKIAAYLHDYCKYDSDEVTFALIQKKDYKECEEYPVLKHSYAAAEFYRSKIGTDEEIYQAIRNHVFGRLGMSKLEEILLISDYTEENRTYPSCIRCREILNSGKLNLAIYESTKFTIDFVKKQGFKPHPLQVEVLKYYEGLCEK